MSDVIPGPNTDDTDEPIVQPSLIRIANVGDGGAEGDHLRSNRGEPNRAHEQDGGQNSQGALRVHMNNFSDLRSEYKLATKSP